jgi:hypothetical protein
MEFAGSIRRRRSYQETQEIKAIAVAKSSSSRCSGCPRIPRWRCACGQQDPVEVPNVDVRFPQTNKDVRVICRGSGKRMVQTRE